MVESTTHHPGDGSLVQAGVRLDHIADELVDGTAVLRHLGRQQRDEGIVRGHCLVAVQCRYSYAHASSRSRSKEGSLVVMLGNRITSRTEGHIILSASLTVGIQVR